MRKLCFRSSFIIALVAAFLLHGGTASSASAQSRTSSLKAGAGLTTFAGTTDYQALPNLAASLSLRQPVGALYLQTEAQIASRSARLPDPPIEEPSGPDVTRLETGFTYIDVPLLVGLQLPVALRPFAHAGPYAGVRVNARTSVTFGETVTITQSAENVHRFDYGAMAGVGANIDTRFYQLAIELRGMMGMAPIFQEGADHSHLAILLMAGITL